MASLLYKNKLKSLVKSVLLEDFDPYANSQSRIPFNEEAMKEYIRNGQEIAVLFQSDNKQYRMPINKYRVIVPVAMGIHKASGDLSIRAVHIEGQSEIEAIRTGIRSAQAKMQWRLLKAINIKRMYPTGRTYDKVPIAGYNPNDSGLSNISAKFREGGSAQQGNVGNNSQTGGGDNNRGSLAGTSFTGLQ